MNEDYGANIVVLTDDDGVDHEFEHLDTIEIEGKLYMAFVPAGIPDDSDEPVELMLLRADKDENGEDILSSIEDEGELDAVYQAFMEEAFEDDEEE